MYVQYVGLPQCCRNRSWKGETASCVYHGLVYYGINTTSLCCYPITTYRKRWRGETQLATPFARARTALWLSWDNMYISMYVTSTRSLRTHWWDPRHMQEFSKGGGNKTGSACTAKNGPFLASRRRVWTFDLSWKSVKRYLMGKVLLAGYILWMTYM